ncbi:hypothetical protein [Actinophytocola sp.]|uniref:hypothetical protein n=1 Tax=Actinophytocola sp. TaxID=1872138 RepID=UPI002ED0F101
MIVSSIVAEGRVRNPWANFGVLAPLVPLGGVAMALLAVAAHGGEYGWLGVVFAALGFAVLPALRGLLPSWPLSAALLGVAAWYAGSGLWSPQPPFDVADRLLGENLPGIGRYTAFLSLVLSTVGMIAASVLAYRHRDEDWTELPTREPAAVRRWVALLAAGAVLTGGAWLGGAIWAGRAAAAVVAETEDRTTAAEAPDPRSEPPRGPEKDLALLWSQGDDVRYGDQAALVPGTDTAVALGFEAGVGTEYGLFVLDARTGEERWHYWIRDIVNTSPGGFMGVVVGMRTNTLLAVVSNVGILFDLDTGQVRNRFALPPVPGESTYRVLSDSPLRNDRSVIQLSSQPVGYLTARGEDVATLLSVDLDTGEVHTADQAPSGECHYQYAGQSTMDDGAFLVRSGRGCERSAVLSMTRERIAETFDLPAVEQEATTCSEQECDGPAVSVADGRLVVNVGRELLAFDADQPLWTSPVPEQTQATAVGDAPLRVVVETPTDTTVLSGDTGAPLGPLAPLPGTGNGAEVTPDTGWYRVNRLDDQTIELVQVDLDSLTVVSRSEPVSCGLRLASDPPPLSAASGRLLITCWPLDGEFSMTVLGR